MGILRHLQLDEALEREPSDHGCLRRQVGESLHIELKLLLPQLECIAFHACQQHLLVRLEHPGTRLGQRNEGCGGSQGWG